MDGSLSAECCPPHHWLIQDEQDDTQSHRSWVCMRCSQARDEPLPHVTAPRRKYQSSSSWSREEYLLAGFSPDG